jgi:hypothetical protein
LGNGEGKNTSSGMLEYTRQERKWTLGGRISRELHYNKNHKKDRRQEGDAVRGSTFIVTKMGWEVRSLLL